MSVRDTSKDFRMTLQLTYNIQTRYIRIQQNKRMYRQKKTKMVTNDGLREWYGERVTINIAN